MASARDKILKATFECISEKGSASISLRDISKKAQVSLSQIHYYFSGREGLLVEAAAELIKEEIVSLKTFLKDTRNPLSRIEKTIDYVWVQHKNDNPLFKVYFDLLCMSIWNPVLAEQTEKLQEQVIETILDTEMSLGVASETLARFILVFTDGLGLQLLQGTSQEKLEETFLMFKMIVRQYIQMQEDEYL